MRQKKSSNLIHKILIIINFQNTILQLAYKLTIQEHQIYKQLTSAYLEKREFAKNERFLI